MPIADQGRRGGQVGRPHPAAERQGQALAPGRRGPERGPVVVRDAHQDDVPARPDEVEAVATASSVPAHSMATSTGSCDRRRGPIGREPGVRRPGLEGRRDAVVQAVGGQDDRRPERPARADDEQADRPGPDDRDRVDGPTPARSTARSATPRASSWQASSGVEPGRDGHEQVAWPGHPLAQAAVGRAEAGEARRGAQVLAPGRARRARPARLRRVDRRRPVGAPSSPTIVPGDLVAEDTGRRRAASSRRSRPSPTSGCPTRTARRRRPGRGPRRGRGGWRLVADDELVGRVEPGDEHRARC